VPLTFAIPVETVVPAAGELGAEVDGGLPVDDDEGVALLLEEQAAAKVSRAATDTRAVVRRALTGKPGLDMIVPPWVRGGLVLHRWHV